MTERFCKIGSDFYPEDRMNIDSGLNIMRPFKGIATFSKDCYGLLWNYKLRMSHRI